MSKRSIFKKFIGLMEHIGRPTGGQSGTYVLCFGGRVINNQKQTTQYNNYHGAEWRRQFITHPFGKGNNSLLCMSGMDKAMDRRGNAFA